MKVGALDRHLVSAAILQPAMFGPENFAGDEWVESYMRAASRRQSPVGWWAFKGVP